jgi:hypothetical protein
MMVTWTTGAGGAFKLTDTPTAKDAVKYAGNSTTAPATASRSVSVLGIPATLTMATGATTFTYEPTVHVTYARSTPPTSAT